MSSKTATPFWKWSNWKDSTRDEIRGTVLELTMDQAQERAIYDRLNFGHGPLGPSEVPIIHGKLLYRTRLPDDCPWPVSEMFPVSDRLRRVLEARAPGNCQFVPTKLWHDGQPCDLVYWALYVDSIDCVDQVKSGRSGDLIVAPVILDERVPKSTHLFRIWDPVQDCSGQGIYVRDGLRRVLKRAKVTGCFFYEPSKPSPPPTIYEGAERHKRAIRQQFGTQVEVHHPRLEYLLTLTEVPPAAGAQPTHDRMFALLTAALERSGKHGQEAAQVFEAELDRLHDHILLNAPKWLHKPE